jgi:ATP-binding cassette subfamily B (MDR/TAP) protein 1
MSWFDEHRAGELNARLAADTELIQEGISQKFQACVQFMTTFVSGLVLGFVRGWQLTLVILAMLPLLAIGGGMMASMMQKKTKQGSDSYAKAGEVADEVRPCVNIQVSFPDRNSMCEFP